MGKATGEDLVASFVMAVRKYAEPFRMYLTIAIENRKQLGA